MGEGERTLQQPVDDGGEVKRLRVEIVEGPEAGRAVEPEQDHPIVVGTSSENDVVLRDPTVSRYHVELFPSGTGISVRDLGSLNGTFVGGIRIAKAVVPPGTRIRVGATVIAVEDRGAIAVSEAGPSPRIPGVVGDSPAIRQVLRAVERAAASTVSVLLQGETGTGKEVLARAIHEQGKRSVAPLVVVDCGSMPATLVASELFGHERGAFTGAERRHAGAFERADGGTVFLDEIGELPLSVQPALLGVLERKRFRRVGGTEDLRVDVRVISATHRDLRAEVNRGGFRADLYYRLAVARIVIPPLRERVEDIEPLVAHFVEELTGGGDAATYFGAQTMAALRSHPWSGNVRELRNVVESALAMGRVTLDDGSAPAASVDAAAPLAPYREARAAALSAFERAYLERLVRECAGNASEAARRARMDRPYLLSLLKRHGLR